MNISEAQEKYDNELPDDNECEECENWKRRGDELFDALETAHKELDQKEEAFDDLADRLRERDDEVARLTKLLIDNGIDVEIEGGNMSDVMFLSQRNPYAESAWITTRNTHGENRFQVILELDGVEDILSDHWVPSLDSSEGVHLYSHQISGLFIGRDKKILSLEQELETTKRRFELHLEEFKKFITYHDNRTLENHLGLIEAIDDDINKLKNEKRGGVRCEQ